MRILVTGVAGFVGRHLLGHLVTAGGCEVHGVDHASLDAMAEAGELRSGLASYRPLDITDAAAMEAWVREEKPDAIVHLAAQASGAESLERPAATYRVNALGQRIRKTNGTDDRVFHYDTKGHLIAESDPGGQVLREYLYLNDIPLAVIQ